MTKNEKIIDWQSLDPEEVGEDMVDAIRNLNSDDPEVRMEALTDLFNISWHQGTMCWQAPFVPPFLRQFLPQGSVEEKEWILFNLAHIATGILDEKPDLVRDAYEEVYKGVNLYLDLLEDDSAKVRKAAAYALSCCPKEAEIIIPKLRQRFHCEPDELVKVTIPLCLTFISKTAPVDADFLEQIINSEETDLVKLSAAVSLAYVAGEKMSDSSLEKLVKLLEVPELFNRLCEYYEMPMATAHNWITIDFLTRLREEHKAKIIPVLLQVYSELDEVISFPFQWQKVPEGTTIDDLTDSQQFVLRAIANDERLWNDCFSNTIVTSIIGIKASSGQEQRQKLIDFINGEPLKYDR